MTKLKTINIQGKSYVEVNERLKYFRSQYPGYSLISEVVETTETSILIKATIFDDNQNPIASGIAQETKGSSFINKTSYVENCETSAWGRALANFGIGIDEAVASYNEVANAIANQNSAITSKPKKFDLEEVLKGIEYYRAKGWEDEQIFKQIEDTYKDLDGGTIKLIKEKSNVEDTKPKTRNRKSS